MSATDDLPPDLGLLLYDTVPEGFEDEFLEAVRASELAIRSGRHAGGPYAGMELYLPFAVMLFIASKYFEGFFSRAGGEHFDRLVAASKKLWKQSSRIEVVRIGTVGKLSMSPRFGMQYAIVGEVAPRLRFKLIIELGADDVLGEEAIEAFLILIRDLHAGTLSDSDVEALLTHRPVGGTVLVTFDGQTKRIRPVDGMGHN